MNAITSIIKKTASDLFDIAWPRTCLGCGQRLMAQYEHLLCSNCLTEIPTVDYYKQDSNYVTEEFYREDIYIEYGCCYFQFKKSEWTQNLMHNIKYYKQPDLAVKLGHIAALELKNYNRFADADFILPVPMHPDKVKIRGFNQAERIAAGISKVMQIPVREDILEKTVNSATQTFMARSERIKNADKIFVAKRVGECAKSHFLIVDDVFTTGSTLLICAKKIHEAMPEARISVFALAKA